MTMARQRKVFESEFEPEADSRAIGPVPVLLYAGDRCVSVVLSDPPSPLPDDGVCRCGACKTARVIQAD
jgi:hypothetical protein